MSNEKFEVAIENEIKEKGLNAPRVTKADIDSLMKQVKFVAVYPEGTTTTLVLATLDGFTLATGFSACVSKENFNKELGAKIASEDAARKARDELWKLEGYRLARSLKDAPNVNHIVDSHEMVESKE